MTALSAWASWMLIFNAPLLNYSTCSRMLKCASATDGTNQAWPMRKYLGIACQSRTFLNCAELLREMGCAKKPQGQRLDAICIRYMEFQMPRNGISICRWLACSYGLNIWATRRTARMRTQPELLLNLDTSTGESLLH
jgi:hypothetical protein